MASSSSERHGAGGRADRKSERHGQLTEARSYVASAAARRRSPRPKTEPRWGPLGRRTTRRTGSLASCVAATTRISVRRISAKDPAPHVTARSCAEVLDSSVSAAGLTGGLWHVEGPALVAQADGDAAGVAGSAALDQAA